MSIAEGPRAAPHRILSIVLLVVAAFAVLAGFFYTRQALLALSASDVGQAPEVRHSPNDFAARFASMEGSVQVKRAGTLVWVTADPAMILRRFDLVKTGSGAVAEIRFMNGDEFHVRPDSIITIEERIQDPPIRTPCYFPVYPAKRIPGCP